VTSTDPVSASKVVRAVFATGTVVFFAVGLLVRDDPRWFAAAGALGLVWWVWDILVDYVFLPFSDWFFGLLTGQHAGEPMNDLRPSMDDTIRLLESHLEHDASEQVCVNAAIRLEEIYRTVKKDSKRARQVVESVREQYPEAPEWERFDRLDDSDEEQAYVE
jgi:hypothetical protein